MQGLCLTGHPGAGMGRVRHVEPVDGHYDDLGRVSPDVIERGLALLAGLLLPLLAPALPPVSAGLWLGGALLGAVAVCLRGSGPRPLLGAVLLGLCVTGAHAARWAERELPAACERELLSAVGRVTGLPEAVQNARDEPLHRVTLSLEHLSPARCQGPRTVEVYWPAALPPVPGEAWALGLRLRRPWGAVNPGAWNSRAGHLARGVHALGSVSAAVTPQRRPQRDRGGTVDRWRQRFAGALGRELPAAGLLRALAVADRSGIGAADWARFQRFGVAHLLVISGLHVGMVAGLGALLGAGLARLPGWGGQAPRLLALGALVSATLYTALAGWSIPTTRAWVMLACSMVASLVGRSAWAPLNLLLAALAVLLLNPFSALSPGFWLSFAAVASLFWLSHWRGRAAGAARLGLAHLFICLVMFPLGAVWFGAASLVAPLANALLVPLTAVAVVPPVLAGILLWPLQPMLAAWFWQAAGRVLELVLSVMQRAEALMPIPLTLPLQMSPGAVLLAVIGLGLLVLPLDWPRRLACGLLLLPLLLPLREHRVAGAGAVHVLALDVGQGTAVLIHDQRRALLYDTGSPWAARSVVLPVLRGRGIRRLDQLVLSHGDADHAGGVGELEAALEIDRLLLGADLPSAAFDGAVSRCRAGRSWSWGPGVWFRILAPAPGEVPASRNAGSCVLQASLWGQRWLLAGDIDARRERSLVNYWGSALGSQWLLAPHHGSASSSSWAWLKAVRPRQVVYSHGRANPFGHPAASVEARYAARDIVSYSTAAQGAVEWVIEPAARPRVVVHRQLARRFWWGR